MSKYYIIIAHDGTEIIDATPKVEARIAAMDDLDRRYKQEKKIKKEYKHKLAKNPLYKFANMCGIL